MWSPKEARGSTRAGVTLLRSTVCWSLTQAGGCVLCITEKKMLTELMIFLVMPIPDVV